MKDQIHITSSGTVYVPISLDMIYEALPEAIDIGILKNSIRAGGGNLVGMLGEAIVLKAFPEAISCNTYHHDIMINGKKYEVKAKDRTVDAGPTDEGSVANYNANQKADFYIFTSIYRNKKTDLYTHGHIMGMWPCATYKDHAMFREKGWRDTRNNWVVSADCYNMEYAWLHRMRKLWAEQYPDWDADA